MFFFQRRIELNWRDFHCDALPGTQTDQTLRGEAQPGTGASGSVLAKNCFFFGGAFLESKMVVSQNPWVPYGTLKIPEIAG